MKECKKQGGVVLKRLINSGLERTSNTCILIGSQTYERQWLRYELADAYSECNTLTGLLMGFHGT